MPAPDGYVRAWLPASRELRHRAFNCRDSVLHREGSTWGLTPADWIPAQATGVREPPVLRRYILPEPNTFESPRARYERRTEGSSVPQDRDHVGGSVFRGFPVCVIASFGRSLKV